MTAIGGGDGFIAPFFVNLLQSHPLLAASFAPQAGWVMILPVLCSTLCWTVVYLLVSFINKKREKKHHRFAAAKGGKKNGNSPVSEGSSNDTNDEDERRGGVAESTPIPTLSVISPTPTPTPSSSSSSNKNAKKFSTSEDSSSSNNNKKNISSTSSSSSSSSVMMGAEWNCRTVSMLHAITSVILTSASIFGWGPWPMDLTNLGLPNTPYQVFVMHVSIGYFMFDFFWCLKHGESLTVFAHHLSSLAAAVLCIGLGCGGTPITSCIFGSEITNPMLQMRWFLREMKRHYPSHPHVARWDSWILWNEWYFFFGFTMSRIVLGPYLLYMTLVSTTVPIPVKMGGSAIQIISVGWWVLILKKVKRLVIVSNKKGIISSKRN